MFSTECVLLSHRQKVKKPKLNHCSRDLLYLVDRTGCKRRRKTWDDIKLLVPSKVKDGAAIHWTGKPERGLGLQAEREELLMSGPVNLEMLLRHPRRNVRSAVCSPEVHA